MPLKTEQSGRKAEGKVRNNAELLKANMQLDPSKLFEYKLMIDDQFRRYGPTKSRITVKTREKATTPLLAGIDPDTWDVKFLIDSGLRFREDPELLKFLDRRNVVDPVREMLRATAFHEMGHWELPRGTQFGCPYDRPTYYTSFIEPIYDELKKSGKFSDGFCKAMASRLANAVMDVIDNYNMSNALERLGEQPTGQMLFWYLQSRNGGGYGEEYTLFVRLNLALFGTKEDINLLRRFFSKNSEINNSVGRLEQIFSPEAIYSKEKWESLAREYAKEALNYLNPDKKSAHQYSPDDRTASGSKQSEGDSGGEASDEKGDGKGTGGSGGEGEEKKEEGEGSSGGSEKDKGREEGKDNRGPAGGEEGEDDEERKIGFGGDEPGSDLSPDDIEKIMGGRAAGRMGGRKAGGSGIPFYIKTNEALDAYYRVLAKRIPLKMEGKIPGGSFPIIPVTRETFDPEVHSIEDAVTSRLHLDPLSRSLLPSVVKTRLTVGIPIRKEKKQLPDFMFTLIDSSGSMMGRGDTSIVPWGDQSYYHYALLTFWGLLRFFEMERILHKIDVAAAIFSSATLDQRGLADVKRMLLNPATGGTVIDMDKVLKHLQGKQRAMFSMISDGEIYNWANISEQFIEVAKRNQFFMIQIGSKTGTSTDLDNAGLHVYYVSSPQEIVRLAIDLTVKRYRHIISGGLDEEARKYTKML